MDNCPIEVIGLGKKYRLRDTPEPYGRLTESLWEGMKSPIRAFKRRHSGYKCFWALRNASFNLREGEVVGFVGRNGAGKTTLLKILSRITEPTIGSARIQGRVRSLLEVGTGFHPELTGRENIYLNGALLGMRKSETRQRFDEIVAFSEVERFLETPVKRYSTGMYIRLAFAVAAHLDSEILIVDEVLSVGDASFQKKCLDKMGEASAIGKTVLFVSHNLTAVERLCSRAFFLDKGEIVFEGTPLETTTRYLHDASIERPISLNERQDRKGSASIKFVEFSTRMTFGLPGYMAFKYQSQGETDQVDITVRIFTLQGAPVTVLSTEFTGGHLQTLPREGWLVCSFPQVALLPGVYSFDISGLVGGLLADSISNAGRFPVLDGDFFRSGKVFSSEWGSIAVSHHWSLEEISFATPRQKALRNSKSYNDEYERNR